MSLSARIGVVWANGMAIYHQLYDTLYESMTESFHDHGGSIYAPVSDMIVDLEAINRINNHPPPHPLHTDELLRSQQ